MASYRPFPPPPAQNPLPPPPPPPPPPPSAAAAPQPQQRPPTQFAHANYSAQPAPSTFPQSYPQQQTFSHNYPPRSQHNPPPPPPHQQYPYQPPPPPPPPDSSFPPPPPPPPPAPSQPQQQPPVFFPPSQYNQYAHQQIQPPPPSSPPPSSSVPPPPPPGSPPPPPPKESAMERDKGVLKERRDPGTSGKQQPRPPVPSAGRKVNGAPARVETEEERRLRKKREYEKQRQEEKHRHQLKESHNSVLQKSQILSAQKGHGSIVGSRMADRRTTPLLTGDRAENRLKKPTTFLCKLKFRNELPDPCAQPKLMTLKKEKDRFMKYTITSLEKMHKPQLFVEPDLGVPLDLLDLSVYNPPSVRPPLAPEDEELLRDDELATPIKRDGIKRKERPTDRGVSWLVKTQYISSLSTESTKQSLTEKQAKELREMKEGGRNLLENINDRDRQIKDIEASFEANKLHPVHATNKNLHAVEILPLLPDFDRYKDKFVLVAFDGAPTVDSEIYSKLDPSVRDVCESRAVMKACVAPGSDPSDPEKFLAYMVPNPNELSKDMYDENEDMTYSWAREYHWDIRGDDANNPTTYLVSFDETEARYVPLPTKLNLRKKRAREGKSNEEVERFPVPSKVTVRRRSTAATIEVRDSGVNMNSRAMTMGSRVERLDDDDGLERHRDIDHSSGAEDDLSE